MTTSGAPAPRTGSSARLAFGLTGTMVGLVLAVLSLTPSLLPRTGVNQGLVTGIAFAAGYLIGAAVAALARWGLARRRPVSRGVPWWAWVASAALGALAFAVMLPVGWGWQNEQRLSFGGEAAAPGEAAIAVGIAAVSGVALVFAGKGIAAIERMLRRAVSSRGRRPWAPAVSVASVGLALLALAAGGVVAFAAYTEQSAVAYNASYSAVAHEPDGRYRSVGVGSALSWENAGREGRYILAGGPTASQIEQATDAPALTPIRIYAGLDEPGTWDDHAAAVVSELDRTGAAERAVVVLAATTGSGWLDAEAIDALEYLHHGDTALATMQYGKSESWHSFLFHPGAYREATSALMRAVGQWWSQLPGERPSLYLYGLSLGSRAIQDSFTDADALRAFGDGVVLAGTPYGTQINETLTAERDAGSTVVVPWVDDGIAFRWFASGIDVAEAGGRWDQPRVSYVQHGTDPIVWAGIDSVWARPEWLEPAQRSVELHPAMRWYPVVTGIQLMLDTAVDLSGPDGAGHRYGYDTLEAWIAVTGDGGNPSETLDRIRQIVMPEGGAPFGSDV